MCGAQHRRAPHPPVSGLLDKYDNSHVFQVAISVEWHVLGEWCFSAHAAHLLDARDDRDVMQTATIADPETGAHH